MNIHAEKIELAKLLLETTDKGILQKVKALLKGEALDWWDEISEEERKEIQIGIEQAKSGQTVPHAEAVKQFAKWGLK